MTHTVKPGESLSQIAADNGISLGQLLDANPLFKANPDNVQVGAILNIPGTDVEPAVTPPPAPPAPVAPTAADQELGSLSAKFEVGNRGPGTVSGGQGD